MAIEGPGHDRDVDEEFARIIAGWDDVATTSGSAALPPAPRMPVAPEDAAPGEGAPRRPAPADERATDEASPLGPHDAPERQDGPGAAAPEPHDEPASRSAPPGRPGAPGVAPLEGAPPPADAASAGTATGRTASGKPASGEAAADPATGDPATGDTAYGASTDPNALAWRGYVPDEPDEHFEPPEPHLPPAHDATYWLAVVGLVAGPLLVLWAVVLSGNPDPGWLIVAGLLLTVGGFGLLVMRGSGERDPDDDGSRV